MERLEGNADCPPELILAIESFNDRLTKSHTRSARSNRFSIWHLLREEIEPTVVKILGPKLFEEIAPQGFSDCAISNSRGLEDRCRQETRAYSEMGALSQEDWYIYGTLDFLITLLHFCNSRLPHTYSAITGRLKLRTNLQHFPFCELCDRLCEAEKNRVSGVDPEYAKQRTPSMRFCERHKPGTNGYRRDLSYRDAFHKKIAELEEGLRNKTHTEGSDELREVADDYCFQGYDIMLSLISHFAQGDNSAEILEEYSCRPKNCHPAFFNIDKNIRHVAYNVVHKKSVTLQRISIPRDRNTLVQLKTAIANGKNIPMAAREIGISRQAAWKALKKAGVI